MHPCPPPPPPRPPTTDAIKCQAKGWRSHQRRLDVHRRLLGLHGIYPVVWGSAWCCTDGMEHSTHAVCSFMNSGGICDLFDRP